MVRASGFEPEDTGSIPDAAKDLPHSCGVYAHKIPSSENPVVGR